MSSRSFLDRIAQAAERHGNRPAFSSVQRTASYTELFAIARGIRDEIGGAAGGPVRRIGLVTGDDVETYAALLAVWSLGAAYVPLNAHNPPDRNARIAEQAALDMILTSRDPQAWAGHLPDAASLPTVLSIRNISQNTAPLPIPGTASSDLAYLFFTSGSTGAPKGVPITHGNLSAFMDMLLTAPVYDFGETDRFLQMFELTFDLSVVSILAPWSVGACCCAVPERGIAWMNILNVLQKEKITVALMVPSVLPYLQRFFGEVSFPALRVSQFCGEALMHEMTVEWSQCLPYARIENVYGPTEATIWCTRYEWDRRKSAAESVNGIVPIGKPMPGTRAHIIDENGQPCRPGQRGELCLAGDQVMSGYWNDPGKTAQSFVKVTENGGECMAYRTGDIAYLNERGDLIYCGRRDSQVKIDGHRVELGEIEHHARQFIGNSSAAVVLTGLSGSNRLTLFVGGADIDHQGLQEHLKANLPGYMRPSATKTLPELPLNLNGKIDRPALARLAAGEPAD